MPGTKQRTVRRKKICPPHKRVSEKPTSAPPPTSPVAISSPSTSTPAPSSTVVQTPTTTTVTPSASPSGNLPLTPSISTRAVSASKKKLSKSPHTNIGDSSSDEESVAIESGILEVDALNEAMKSSVSCKECSGGPVVLMQDQLNKKGLSTNPSLQCEHHLLYFATFKQGTNSQP